jgi:hypothetical protein
MFDGNIWGRSSNSFKHDGKKESIAACFATELVSVENLLAIGYEFVGLAKINLNKRKQYLEERIASWSKKS